MAMLEGDISSDSSCSGDRTGDFIANPSNLDSILSAPKDIMDMITERYDRRSAEGTELG